MLDPNFIPPKPRVAETQTKKRITIIESLIPELSQYCNALLLTGSMAYGQDYSVTPESDIDLQFLITPDMVSKLSSYKYFQKYNIARIEKGFREGIFQQFSLNFIYREVPVECHFWDEKTYKDILLYKKDSVIRLRSQTKKVAIDHSYSFDGEEDVAEYPDFKKDDYHVGVFPAYKIKDKKIFLSRPITNILGNAIVLFDDCDISTVINECRSITESKMEEAIHEKGKTYSLFNTLPGKNKVAEEVKIMLI